MSIYPPVFAHQGVNSENELLDWRDQGALHRGKTY